MLATKRSIYWIQLESHMSRENKLACFQILEEYYKSWTFTILNS